MADLTRGERLQIMLTGEEIEALDNWRFARRMPSRAAAVRELLKRGLSAEGFISAEAGSHSRDFGVIGPSDESPSTRPEGREIAPCNKAVPPLRRALFREPPGRACRGGS